MRLSLITTTILGLSPFVRALPLGDLSSVVASPLPDPQAVQVIQDMQEAQDVQNTQKIPIAQEIPNAQDAPTPQNPPNVQTPDGLLPPLGASRFAKAEGLLGITTPLSDGDYTYGYRSIVVPDTFDLERMRLFPDKKTTMPVLRTNGFHNSSEVNRVVIAVQGKQRNCWEIASFKNAEVLARRQGLIGNGTLLVAPCFLAPPDRSEGASEPTDFIWGLTTWASGQKAIGPEDSTDIASFDVLDALVEKYLDMAVYPNVKSVVVAGHSLGGQTVQRYAAIAKDSSDTRRTHYWTGNPGSLLWLSKDRPLPQFEEGCEGVDRYKFGLHNGFPAYQLGELRDLGREGIVKRYRERNIHHLWGLLDNGPGDTRCQAKAQGLSHLERGQRFDTLLQQIGGRTNNTVDYVPGVSHEGPKMFMSDAGIDKKLFVYEQKHGT